MDAFLTNELFLYLALICICLSFVFYLKARKRRKKELEKRGSLRQRFSRRAKKEEVA